MRDPFLERVHDVVRGLHLSPREATRGQIIAALARSRLIQASLPERFDDTQDIYDIVHHLPPRVVLSRLRSWQKPQGWVRPIQPILPGREPHYNIRVHAVLCADSDGQHAANITSDQLVALFQGLTNFYFWSGFIMTFDPTKDITLLKDTVINQDFTLPTGVNLSSPDPPISDAEKNASFNQHNTVRSTWAMDNHKGRLVIFFRYGTSVSWDQNKKKWIVGWATFAFSGSEHQFVAMNQGTELLLLDHEMGHYFHLGHTHSGATELADADKQKYPDPDHNPADKEGRLEVLRAKVVEVIRNFVDDQNHPADTGLNALDADQLSDTPPDPGPQIFEYEFGAPCSPMGLAIEVPLKSGARTYVLDPDRDNVMSYFFRCSGNKHFSPQQIDRIRAAVENPNFPPGTESRHHLIEGS